MRLRYVATITLLCLLAWFQYQLWTGRGSIPNVQAMQEEIRIQQSSNELMQQDNQRVAADILDLRHGQDKMEEIARQELGMIKPNEVFIQYTKP